MALKRDVPAVMLSFNLVLVQNSKLHNGLKKLAVSLPIKSNNDIV